MDASEIDWEHKHRRRKVLDLAQELFGERFGGAGFDRSDPYPVLRISAVDPTREEIAHLDEAAKEAGWGVSVTIARYSRDQLIGFMESVTTADLPGKGTDLLIMITPDYLANVIRFQFRRFDQEAVDYISERMPAEAVRIEIEPRGPRAVAISAQG